MLYSIHPEKDIFELNPGLKAVPLYAKLTSRQMTYVCLLCDPSRDNPIRTLSGKQRKERACILAGYPMESDGKRLAKNAREIVEGRVASIEAAIEEFEKNHHNAQIRNREALRKQITEIRDFLESDKRIPLVERGKIILNSKGEEIFTTDQKALKLASELAVKLPELENALELLEAKDPIPKYEGMSYTSADVDPEYFEEGASDLPAIELFMQAKQKLNSNE